jgi:hypothetical protein
LLLLFVLFFQLRLYEILNDLPGPATSGVAKFELYYSSVTGKAIDLGYIISY